MEMVKREGGMLVALIDFTKAYDTVDRELYYMGLFGAAGVN
jgi:hypothetical protein